MTCCHFCSCSSSYCISAHSMSVRFVRICEDADKREIEIVGPINESMGLAETFLQTSQFHKIMKEKNEICHDYIFGCCFKGDKCMGIHSTMPYQWEVENGCGWSLIPDNEGIERDYCDPAKTESHGIPPVNFILMIRGHSKVRRLATVSSLDQPEAVLATKWAWYWEEEDECWNAFWSSTMEDLERVYSDPSLGSVFEFTAGRHTYEVNLEDMIQSNKSSHTLRWVRRRPIFNSAIDVQRAICTSNTNTSIVPPYWDQSRLPGIGFERVMLSSSTGEHEDIKALFEKTVVGFQIHTIERVQNPALWKFYMLQRDQMKSSLTSINEKQLFHGTDSKYVDSICRDNFDWRICGKNGTSYGKGSYFARDAQYSHMYTSQSGLRSMFVCQVLVGDYTVGNSRYEKPPPKETGGSSFYDSCVDNIQNPRVFVVFETHQVYPEYLIQYSDGNTQPNPAPQPGPAPPLNPAPQPGPAPPPNPAPQPGPAPPPNPAPQPNPSDSDEPAFNCCVQCLIRTFR
ncbi:protein mono-ADP-ribosyltransferase PARP12-like isoform X1 [Oncorhynchus keta]|uniref:protein mono-ADP-ribosyltransferase PARP12-like isoform X1 n=2 Tax=Oncorhynchus keta TaxID=8018 RepID=UPI0015F927B2|nr:protein mono-ADP-ribosyltransferase PARP12-like isoform X1 [Oncorhynchus keta]